MQRRRPARSKPRPKVERQDVARDLPGLLPTRRLRRGRGAALGRPGRLAVVVPQSGDMIVSVTRSLEPPGTATRIISGMCLRVTAGGIEVRFSAPDPLAPAAHNAAPVILTPRECRDADAAGLRCHWPIEVTGRLAKGGLNLVEIDGTERCLSPQTFPRFLRLLAALFETEDGFVPMGSMRSGGGLADEGYYPSDEVHQANGRLAPRSVPTTPWWKSRAGRSASRRTPRT